MLWPVSAKAVVMRGRSVLLARNHRGEWELPGGRLEPGEEPDEAVVREVAEETGIQVEVVRPLGARTFEVLPGHHVLLVASACVVVADEAPIVSMEHDAVAWHRLDALDDLPLPAVYRELIALVRPAALVLLGDSHLAKLDRERLKRLRAAVGDDITIMNRAVGGATVGDVLAELRAEPPSPMDRVVISVGTNDLAAWKRVPLDAFLADAREALLLLRRSRPVVLFPPPFDEDLQRAAGRVAVRTAAARAPYVQALLDAATDTGATIVDLDATNGRPSRPIHAPDGVHLNDHGYRLLIDRVAQALRDWD